MTILTNCFVPTSQQLRALRGLLRLDESSAVKTLGFTPAQLELVESLADILPDDLAEQRASLIFPYAGALVAAGGTLRLILDDDYHLYDAVIPKRPVDEYVFDPGSVTPTQLRAARIGMGMSHEAFSVAVGGMVSAEELAIIEGLTRSNCLDHASQWWGSSTFLGLTLALRKMGVFLMDPATTGHSEFGLRFREHCASSAEHGE